MSTQTMVAIATIVAFAFTVEAALGFGATVVTVALGSLVLPFDTILPAFVPINIALSGILVVRGIRSVAWRVLLLDLLPWVALGLPVGIFVFTKLDERWLKLVFGVFVVALSSIELAAQRRGRASPDAPAREVAKPIARSLLIVGGMIHGAFATGGPMVVYVMGRTLGDDKARFRATLSVLWLVLNSILLVSFALRGRLSTGSATLSGAFVGSLVVGLGVGELVFRRVSAERFRTFVFGMLALAGVVLFVRNV